MENPHKKSDDSDITPYMGSVPRVFRGLGWTGISLIILILLNLWMLMEGFELVQIIRPLLHHLSAFGQVFRPVVYSTNDIARNMGKLSLSSLHYIQVR